MSETPSPEPRIWGPLLDAVYERNGLHTGTRDSRVAEALLRQEQRADEAEAEVKALRELLADTLSFSWVTARHDELQTKYVGEVRAAVNRVLASAYHGAALLTELRARCALLAVAVQTALSVLTPDALGIGDAQTLLAVIDRDSRLLALQFAEAQREIARLRQASSPGAPEGAQ